MCRTGSRQFFSLIPEAQVKATGAISVGIAKAENAVNHPLERLFRYQFLLFRISRAESGAWRSARNTLGRAMGKKLKVPGRMDAQRKVQRGRAAGKSVIRFDALMRNARA